MMHVWAQWRARLRAFIPVFLASVNTCPKAAPLVAVQPDKSDVLQQVYTRPPGTFPMNVAALLEEAVATMTNPLQVRM